VTALDQPVAGELTCLWSTSGVSGVIHFTIVFAMSMIVQVLPFFPAALSAVHQKEFPDVDVID
jgi:hypothetical protein